MSQPSKTVSASDAIDLERRAKAVARAVEALCCLDKAMQQLLMSEDQRHAISMHVLNKIHPHFAKGGV